MSLLPQIDWNDHSIELLQQAHRTPRFIAWIQGTVFGSIGFLNNIFYKYYNGDSVSDLWSGAVTYSLNDTVATYYGTYLSLQSGNRNNNPNNSPTWWFQISPSFIGAYERGNYNSQKLIYEYALNRYFRTMFRQPTAYADGTSGIWYTPTSDIWIATKSTSVLSFISYETIVKEDTSYDHQTSYWSLLSIVGGSDTTYEFIVWIPTSLSILLGLNYIQIVSKVVNLLAIVGTTFTIQIY